MSFNINSLLSGGVDKIVDSVGNAIDKLVTSDEEKLQLKNQLAKIKISEKENMEKIFLEDKESARNREVELAKSNTSNRTQPLLAIFGVVSFVVLIFYILYKGLGDLNSNEALLVGTLLGSMSSIAKDIYGYYFGSSKSNDDNVLKLFKG